MKLIVVPPQLMPLLEKASGLGEPASVVSVMAASHGGGTINWDDLDFKKPHNPSTMRKVAITYMDIMVEVRTSASSTTLS